jgi:hypothetical protein
LMGRNRIEVQPVWEPGITSENPPVPAVGMKWQLSGAD